MAQSSNSQDAGLSILRQTVQVRLCVTIYVGAKGKMDYSTADQTRIHEPTGDSQGVIPEECC